MNEIKLPALNGGINTRDPEYAIEDNQSPDMLNLWYKDKTLSKRPGQEFATSLSGVYRISKPYNSYQAVHAGKNLYKWDGTTATKITTGDLEDDIADSAGVFVEFGDDLYYMDGAEIWHISSSYVVSAITPYVPTVKINCAPDQSSGNDNEDYNLIGAGFKCTFNGNDSSTTYTLPQAGLDATTVLVSIDGVAKTENTHFTVDRTNGTINFAAGTTPHNAPGSGTNNVEITAYKTVTGNKNKVAKCAIAIPYGGESSNQEGGSRVFMMGNPDYPFHYWRSDLGLNLSYGMTYFPDTAEELLDTNSEPITAAAKMGGELVIFKTSSIYAMGYEFDTKDVYYPVRECHASIGCDMPGSVQLINNCLVFGNTKSGLHLLVDKNKDLENNVKPLSANINKLLFLESGLANAVSTDWHQYYWLCVGSNVYLWDYGTTPYYNMSDYDKAQRRLAWYRFNGIPANDFYAAEELYYASSNGIVRFKDAKNDFDEAYNSYFVSKAYDLGHPDEIKTFKDLYPSFSSDGNPEVTITVMNEDTDDFKSETYDLRSFRWDSFNWDVFTWDVIKHAKTYRLRLNMKKKIYFQIKAESNSANRGMGLAGLGATYFTIRKIK